MMGQDWPGLSVARHDREGPVGFASDLAASHAYLDPRELSATDTERGAQGRRNPAQREWPP